jgi:predicted DNA-binding protein
MGRPPLNVTATSVRLTADIRQRITALVGENRMAVFIREAIEHELARREQASAKTQPSDASSSSAASETGSRE